MSNCLPSKITQEQGQVSFEEYLRASRAAADQGNFPGHGYKCEMTNRERSWHGYTITRPIELAGEEWPDSAALAMWVDNGAGNFGTCLIAVDGTTARLTINVD